MFRWKNAAIAIVLMLLAGGCGSAGDKTAPCKRPAILTSYLAVEGECGPITAINTDRAGTRAAIERLTGENQE